MISLDQVTDLYLDHYQYVFSFALSRTRSQHEAEDIAQETFLRVVRSPSLELDPGKVRTLLGSIAYHLMVDRWRQQARYHDVEPVVLSEDPQDIAERREELRCIRAVLSPVEWQCLVLQWALGRDAREIARRTGRQSAQSVISVCHRARKKLHALAA